LRGYANSLMDAVAEPAFIEQVLERHTDMVLAFVQYAADLPFDALMFAEDWGNQRGVDLGPERWRKLLKPRWARIYEAVHAQGKFACSHCCGSVAEILPDVIEAGLDVLESVQPEAAGMDPYRLKRKYGERITFWGGLGSQSTIPFATPGEIKAEVRRLRAEMARGGGYILAPAKELMIETPTENAVAVFEAFTGQTPRALDVASRKGRRATRRP
ncbi:MAG: uroporphyrinogen decarboxylase family protein, partial [Anaerolineae bacterium]|nr:uroporphyrinogen decarboxylase family protein [Anaerolineae bacterium]